MKKKWGWVAGVLRMAAGLTACGGGDGGTGSQGSQNSASPANSASSASESGASSAAETIYKNNCMSCHGGNLEGSLGPNLQKIGAKNSKEEIAAVIRDGRGGMPAFGNKLSDSDIQALAEWLAAKK